MSSEHVVGPPSAPPNPDRWITAVGDLGRNDRCPCGCGTKLKKLESDERLCAEHEDRFLKEERG